MLLLGVNYALVFWGAQVVPSGLVAILQAGAAAVFAGSVCVAFSYVWIKTRSHRLPPNAVASVQSLASLIPLAALAFAFEGLPAPATWSTSSWLALLYLALVASVVAFWLNYWLLRRMETSAMLLMGVAEVPIAVALGAIVFGERLPLEPW